MGNCTQCGVSVPDGQTCCSMCYGDPYYGKDGYYLNYLQEEELRKIEKAKQEEMLYEKMIEEAQINEMIEKEK